MPSPPPEPIASSVAARAALVRFADLANARLAWHFDRWHETLPEPERRPGPSDLFEAVRDLTLRGGKRLRPALAYYAARCVGSDVADDSLLDAALSIELLQSSLLIHDDIMDRDAERRGGPTVHALMTEATGSAHVGNAIAILAGSLACALSQRLLCESGLPIPQRVAAHRELARMQELVIYGQHLDLIGGAPPDRISKLKTTSYTTLGPVLLGGAVAQASPERTASLRAYATPLGLAFQGRDNLLGVFGDPKQLGKPVGADLREGKRTELVVFALDRADAQQRQQLNAVLGNAEASQSDLDGACGILSATGAKKHLEDLIDRATERSLQALETSTLLAPGRQILGGIALLLARRRT